MTAQVLSNNSLPLVSTSVDDHDIRTKFMLRVHFSVVMIAQLVDEESSRSRQAYRQRKVLIRSSTIIKDYDTHSP
jgi:hypothetical protein